MANLQDKRGTAAALAAANPTPLEGEVLYETDTRKFKVGDGSAAYTSLSYVGLSSIATANGVSAAVALGVATISLGAITPSSVTVSGVITCSAGSAALPSVTPTGDTNTGIWFPAADTVAISTGGVERFRIDSAGNITGTTLSGTNTGDQTAASLGLVIGTNVQAYDAGLLSIAAATTAADRFLYTTALDVYAVATITTFGRSLVDDADASTARTTLGLVIGTNVQAYDAGLLSIAAATTAADRFLYTTALDVYAVATITTFGRSLVDDADAATARTTLGLGTISTQASSAVVITGGTINGATIGATTAATGAFTTLSAQGSVSGFVAFQAPSAPTSHTYTLPTVTGTAGQVLTTNGSSVLSWTAPTVRATITATASQTAFTVSGGYTVGGIDVYLNGIKQVNGDDFTATNGTSITLTQGADAGDILDYVAFGFAVTTGALVKSGDTMTGSLTMTAGTTFTMSGFTETTVVIGNSSTAQTISITNGTQVTCTLTGNCTFTMPTATAGKSFTLLLKTGAGAFTATFTGVKWPGATPTITATASRMDIISFLADGVNWYGRITQNYTP